MANPRPTPTEVRKAKGNPSKRPLNLAEPKPSQDIGECPKYLPEAAKAAWNELIPELVRVGIITKIDVKAFARYCINLAEWRACVDFLMANGPDLVTRNTTTGEVLGVTPYPHTKRKREYEILLLRYETEYGMTPSSRSKLHATPNSGESEINDLLDAVELPPLRIAQ